MIPKALLIKNKKKSLTAKGIRGTANRPRLAVTKSNRYMYAQLIDDINGKTILMINQKELKESSSLKPLEIAKIMGQKLAEKALKLNIKKAIFDRGRFQYHGKVKNIAEGAREGGLII